MSKQLRFLKPRKKTDDELSLPVLKKMEEELSLSVIERANSAVIDAYCFSQWITIRQGNDSY
jgi:hypothetical protein